MVQATAFVGVDDGYAETKIVLPSGRQFRMPSRARAGEHQNIILQGQQAATSFTYNTPDGPYVVGSITEADATAFDAYPTSPMNRVIVAHALRQAGVSGNERVSIATGLPVRRYYRRQKPAEELIQAKKQNLLKNDVESMDGVPLAQVVAHEVVAEGVAAWIDYVMVRTPEGELDIHHERARQRVGVIDIGGRTTDIAVVYDWEMDAARSSTIDIGMIAIRDAVKGSVEDQYDARLTDGQVIDGIEHGYIRLWGKRVEIADHIARAQQSVVARIKAEALRCLGSASDLDQVIFVGGTVMALGSSVDGWFPQQTVGADPAFANARGLQKCAEFLRA